MRGRFFAKFVIFVVIVLVAVMIFKQPGQAADNAQGIAGWISSAANSLNEFFNGLFN